MKEFESRPRTQDPPKTTIGSSQVVDLSLAEKQDLVLFTGTPAYSAICKLMESMLVEARDEAVTIPAHLRDERLAALDQATAMAELYTKLKAKMTYLVAEHLGLMQRKEAEAALEDWEMLESIILDPINQGR
jgi:hypothetical protein